MLDACNGESEPNCMDLLAKRIKTGKDPELLKRLNLLAGIEAFKAARWEQSEKFFLEIDLVFPLFQDTIHYYLGELAYQNGQFTWALKRFREIPPDSRFRTLSKFRLASCLARLKDPAAAEEFETLLKEYPKHPRAAQARFELATLLQTTDPERTKMLWLDVARSDPKGEYGKRSMEKLASLKIKNEDQAKVLLVHAGILLKSKDYKGTKEKLEEALKLLGKSSKSPLLSEISYYKARLLLKERKQPDALKLLDKIKLDNALPETLGSVLLLKAQVLYKKNELVKVIELGKKFLADYPDHKDICEAQTLLGRALRENGDTKEAAKNFFDLVSTHPDCPESDEALWWAGWLYYRDAHYGPAAMIFMQIQESAINRFDNERALYWLARTSEKQQKQTEALEIYRKLSNEYPLSYYGTLAVWRLMEQKQDVSAIFKGRTNMARVDAASELSFDVSSYLNDPAFKRALEYLRLSRRDEANGEFAAFSERYPKDETPSILRAYLNQKEGEIFDSTQLFRTKITSFMRRYPAEGDNALWVMAFPRPFLELVEKARDEFKLDPNLLFALMREESSFNPAIRSPANALGLTQIIPATGKIIARKLKHKKYKFDQLKKPEVSVRFGAFHLDELIDLYKGNVALAISAYNAGSGAVNAWLKKRGKLEMDEFVEDIPFRETRGYTRRVLKSYGIYRYLYTEQEFGFDFWHKPTEK